MSWTKGSSSVPMPSSRTCRSPRWSLGSSFLPGSTATLDEEAEGPAHHVRAQHRIGPEELQGAPLACRGHCLGDPGFSGFL